MTFGVTEDGFIKKDLATIIEEINTEGKDKFGNDLNTDAESSFYGVFTGIFGDRFSNLWDLDQSVYNAFYPNSSGGTSLDNVIDVHIMRLRRKMKTQCDCNRIQTVRGLGFRVGDCEGDE